MKTKYRFLFVLTLMFTLVTSAWAEESWDCGNTKVTLSDDGVLTVAAVDGTDGKMADYESVDDVAWTNYRWQIKSVVISDGVTSIGNYAFPRLYNVQSVSIGKDVKSIGSYAFYEWWNNFNSLTLPSSLEFIANYALKSTNINMLYVKAVTPPVLESDDAINYPMIYVPEGSVNAYKTAEYWKNRSYNIDIDLSDNYVPFSFDFSGYATVSGTVWKGLQQSVTITLNDGLNIASRNNLEEDNTFTPASDAKEFDFGFNIALPEAQNLTFEQEHITSNLVFAPADQTDKLTISAGTPDEKGLIANVKAGDEVKIMLKQGYKLSKIEVLPVTIANVYSSTSVAVANLKVGDIIKGSVSVTGTSEKGVSLEGNRWGYSEGVQPWSVSVGDFTTDDDASFWGFIPYNENGAVGDAWMVNRIDDYNVYLVGITHAIELIINETNTEVTFMMPEDDVTVNYKAVRDITQQVDLEVRIDGTASTRIRIAKDNDGHYQFVTEQGWQFAAIDKLDNNKDLTNGELTYSFKKKEGDEYVGKPELRPGIWRLEATANDDTPYDGTIYGTDIELYEGYEVTVGAGEYATFYKDEAVRVNEADKENFKLYTVSSVSGDKATLSNAFDAAPSNTPFLVYNNTNETKTVLLIPCNEPDLALTVADQFQGTMEEKTFTDADMAAADYYVCNGKQFVKVRGAGTLGANKAYLKFVTDQQLSAPQYISISGDLGEGTTRIDNLNVNDNENGEWYDLNGRKLNGKPAQKGIYIKNGKKVVVK